jgi:HD superfamily phosphohydrolase
MLIIFGFDWIPKRIIYVIYLEMPDLSKVFRDPIHSLISFNKKDEAVLLEIINTPEFQRLRRIRQLGLSSYTFPTSIHDRFSHSIGVSYLVGEFFDSLEINDQIEVSTLEGESVSLNKKQLRLLLKLAGLLHDVGHGPFSHAFEKITSVNHEELSQSIILYEKGNILPILRRIEDDVLKKHAAEWIVDIIAGTFSPIWAKEIISSQLDADRIDYLLRDSYMCGVNYASFDIKWLFQNIEIGNIANEGNRLGLLINAKKGIHAVEAFIVSRYHMYEQVYFHKTTRGFEVLAQKIFLRIDYLMKNNKELIFISDTIPDFLDNKSMIDSYLVLDDFLLHTQFKEWSQNSTDDILKLLCSDLVNRRPFKMVKEVDNDSLFSMDDYDALRKEIGEDQVNYFYFEDEYLNVAYKDTYLLGKKEPEKAEHIWLKFPRGQLKEFSEVSPIINSLKNNTLKRKRAYLHRNFLEQIRNLNII